MYPSSIYCGLKVVPVEVLGCQSIYCLVTWTLRVKSCVLAFARSDWCYEGVAEDCVGYLPYC